MKCDNFNCAHRAICEEWISLGNENYINESDGSCDFYNYMGQPEGEKAQHIVVIPPEMLTTLAQGVVDAITKIDYIKLAKQCYILSNDSIDQLCRLRSDLKTGVMVGSTLRTQEQIDKFILTIDAILENNGKINQEAGTNGK